jgi:hypothetical protein
MVESGKRTALRLIGIAKASTKWPNVTGNLRDSVGLQKTVRPAHENLGLQMSADDIDWLAIPATRKTDKKGRKYWTPRASATMGEDVPLVMVRFRFAMRYAFFVKGVHNCIDHEVGPAAGAIAQEEFGDLVPIIERDVQTRVGGKSGLKRRQKLAAEAGG